MSHLLKKKKQKYAWYRYYLRPIEFYGIPEFIDFFLNNNKSSDVYKIVLGVGFSTVQLSFEYTILWRFSLHAKFNSTKPICAHRPKF